MIRVYEASSEHDLNTVKSLFAEYVSSLGYELNFDHFDRDIKELPGKYAPPDGRLLLAECDDDVAGCVAMRKIDNDVCEMKRLWVRPFFRGEDIGRALAEKLIDEARSIGYKKMLLDTISTMTEALTLYKSLGFKETEPYYDSPVEEAVYFEKDLTD